MKEIAHATVASGTVDYRHEIRTGAHLLVADEPAHAGGQDAGPAPYDLLLASLGACTAITLRMYAGKKGWPLGRLTVDLSLLKDREGHTEIERRLAAEGALDETQWQRLLEIAEKTPVTLTLKSGATIRTARA